MELFFRTVSMRERERERVSMRMCPVISRESRYATFEGHSLEEDDTKHVVCKEQPTSLLKGHQKALRLAASKQTFMSLL